MSAGILSLLFIHPPTESLLGSLLEIHMSSTSLLIGVRVSTVSAKCATPAMYAQENPGEHQPSSDAGRKQMSLLTENSGDANLPYLLTVFHRAIAQR